jgi:Protein of unknown function (DUF1091)
MKKGRSWLATNIDVTVDFCLFIKGMRVPLFDVFAPGVTKTLDEIFPECPFQGGFNIDNYTVVSERYPTNNALGTQFKTDIMLSNEKLTTFATCTVYTKVYKG